jgi:hypothetical protein
MTTIAANARNIRQNGAFLFKMHKTKARISTLCGYFGVEKNLKIC